MPIFSGYRITSPYGDRRGTKHRGIDLFKAHKAPIESFTDGKVIFAGQTLAGTGLGNYGIAVVVQDDSPSAALHLYAHLDQALVSVGDDVQIGTVIGTQGNTGHVIPAPTPANPTAGSHLHYEVRLKSSPSYGLNSDTDPAIYLLGYRDWKEEELMLKELQEQIEELAKRLDKLEKKPEQTVADWAKAGYEFVTADRDGETISDGQRPRDPVTRQEMWAMLERYDRLVKKTETTD